MSSRRKSSNPCVLRASSSTAEDSVEMDVSPKTMLDRYSPVPLTTDENWMPLKDKEEEQSEEGSASEQNYHEEIPQSEGLVSTFYLCTICNFTTNKSDTLLCHNKVQHSGESRFKVRHIKLDSQSILEQTIESKNDECLPEARDTIYDLGPFVDSSNPEGEDTRKTPMENSSILEKGLDVEKELDSPVLKDEIRALSVNGTIIIPEPTSHVTPLLQRPPNLSTSPTIAVPLHTNKYNPILDSNVTLITSFNRFPYPTHAELSWLTAASKHPEEQIKVWFTTQRLKQGITWSPEEVEEARKKMFNGSIPLAHQTCKIWPAPVGEPLNPCQATCHRFGQTTLASNTTADRSPGTAAAVHQAQRLKRPLGTPLLASEFKRPTGDPKESLCMPPPPAPPPERLAIAHSHGLSDTKTSSPGSLVASDTKRPVAAHFVPPKGNPLMVQSKEKIPVALPSVLPKERLPLSPIVSSNLKRSVIDQQISNHISASSFLAKNKFGNGETVPLAPAVVTQQESRQTIIQTPSAVPLSLSPTPVLQYKSIEPSAFPGFSSQNGEEIPDGDAKQWFFEQTTNSQNASHVEFALRERSVPIQFPLLERVKDKSPGQMKLLEESFQRNSFPSYNEVEHLVITTRLSREEIESWFLERRALRDDLEQALLNSMGSKRESQQILLNGAQRRSGSLTFSPVPQVSKSAKLLKNVFVQNRWPVELKHLEMQAQLARTELVRWFRDSRLAQQSHVLDRKEMFGERNGCLAADATKRPLREENTKPSSPEIENWFGNTGSNGEPIGEGREDCGGNTCELFSDAD